MGETIEAVEDATGRLLATVAKLEATAVAEPSLLPGWTRGHVLAHLASHAAAQHRMLDGAERGELVPQYPSAEARAAEIEEAAAQPGGQIVADLRERCAALAERYRSLASDLWDAPIQPLGRSPRPARTLLWSRRREVEIHHVDLAAGRTHADWDIVFAAQVIDEASRTFASRGDPPAMRLVASDLDRTWETGPEPALTVVGACAELCAWLIGRAPGEGLRGDPSLPTPPRWA